MASSSRFVVVLALLLLLLSEVDAMVLGCESGVAGGVLKRVVAGCDGEGPDVLCFAKNPC